MKSRISITTTGLVFALAAAVPLLAQDAAKKAKAAAVDGAAAKDAVAADDGVEARLPNGATRLAAQYQAAWSAESRVIAKLCSVDEKILAQITESLKPAFNQLAKARMKAKPNNFGMHIRIGFPEEMHEIVLPAVKKVLEPDQFKRYEADVIKRTSFFRHSLVAAMSSTLEEALALDAQQTKDLLTLLNKRYDIAWFSYAQRFGVPPFDKAFLSDLDPILTEKQRLARKGLTRVPQRGVANQAVDPQAFEKREDKAFRSSLQVVVDARLEMLGRVFDLDEQKARKMTVLARGIQEEIASKRADARRAMMNGANRRDPFLSDYANAPPAGLFVNHPRWSAYVAKMLTDEQSAAYTKLTEDRQAKAKSKMATMMTIGMTRDLALSGEQMEQFAQLLIDELPPRRGSRMDAATMRVIVDLPVDRVGPIIGEENMARWNDEMAQGRKILEELEIGDEKE